ncbi:recombinase family protein [Pseudoalteromonas fenneropenaei]|uniref:Recombinase family protein n=1 Tax=Pseudoalteromonas fenneropenaei TaxID=1737459 RepID=A0ABV7CLN2_9GAMM
MQYEYKPKIYSYVRFSSAKQERGHSKKRQTEMLNEWLADNPNINIPLDQTLDMQDLGVSAWKSYKNNLSDNTALGGFLSMAEQGRIAPGSILVIEQFDRLSRDEIVDAMAVVLNILKKGIEIVSLADRQKYTRQSVNENTTTLMLVIHQLALGHGESQKKSDRCKRAWRNKKEQALEHGKALGNRGPSWLKYDRSSETYIEIPEYADVIRIIFDWIINRGWKIHKVISGLNDMDIKPFGLSKTWNKSFIQSLLRTRRVCGYYEPHHLVKGKRVICNDLPEVKLYPETVSESDWVKANKLIQPNDIGSNSGKTGKASNLFRGLCTCASCGSMMQFENKGAGNSYLVCKQSLMNGPCQPRVSFRYPEFEKAFFKYCSELNWHAVLIPEKSLSLSKSLQTELDVLSSQRERNKTAFERLLMLDGENDMVIKRLSALTTEIEKIDQEAARLKAKIDELNNTGMMAPEMIRDELTAAIADINSMSDDELIDVRIKIQRQLKLIIHRISFGYANGDKDKPLCTIGYTSGVNILLTLDSKSSRAVEVMESDDGKVVYRNLTQTPT